MSLNLHPDAAVSFNADSQQLSGKMQWFEKRKAPSDSFKPDIHISGAISAKDIIGDIHTKQTDSSGRTTSRFVIRKGRHYGLGQQDYSRLVRACEGLQRAISGQAEISYQLIEDTMFAWLLERSESEDPRDMVSCVLPILEQAVKRYVVWIPLARLHVEQPIMIGNVIIRQLDWQRFEEWKQRDVTTHPEDIAATTAFFDRESERLRGRAVAEVTVVGDRTLAEDRALEQAETAAGLLRLFSEAAQMPACRSYCVPLGCENEATAMRIVFCDGRIVGLTTGYLDSNVRPSWTLSRSMIDVMEKAGLRDISAIYVKANRSEFETSVLDAALLYSRMTILQELSDKLVYVLAALESLFLKNDSEAVAQNLGQRLAMLVGKNVPDRKKIMSLVRQMYVSRSKFLHHGHRHADVAALADLMYVAWHGLFAAVDASPRFATKDTFLATLDDALLS